MSVANEIKVHSFDVFDTCITRVYANPRDIFYVLGYRIFGSVSNEQDRWKFARKFHKARIVAEKIVNFRARRNRFSKTDIFSIYEIFQYLCKTGMSTQDLISAELALECECIYPIPYILSKIDGVRAAGGKIAFISDMYIPGHLLAPILQHHGILKDGDTLYVSCDHCASKYSGHLFAHVLSAEKILPAEMLHTGDNFHADILMARKIGINAEHFHAAHLSRHEKNIRGADHVLDVNKSWLAAFSRRCRLNASDVEACHEESFGMIHAAVIPLLLAYVIWVIEHAKSNGIKRLFFVARDGEILYKIAKELCIDGKEMELCYLHGSRRAWLAPSMVSGSLDWLKMLTLGLNKKSPADIAEQIDLDSDEREKLRELLGFSSEQWNTALDYAASRDFYAALANNNDVSIVLNKSSEKKRHIMHRYLKQMGMFDGCAWAIVDAGWSLNSQAALKRVLNFYDPELPVRGYYIGLSKYHLSEEEAGQYFPWIPRAGSLISRRAVIVEHCCLPSLHASTIGYELTKDMAQPAFGEEIRGSEELSYARQLHEAGIAAARLVAKEQGIYQKFSTLNSAAAAVFSDFIENPDIKDTGYLSRFGVISEIRHAKSFLIPLCRSLGWRDVYLIILMNFLKKRKFSSPGYMWLEGSAVMSSACKKIIVKSMLRIDHFKNKVSNRH